MNNITNTIAASATAVGLLLATSAVAQDQMKKPQAEAPAQSQQKPAMMEGMQGGDMKGMSQMMASCNEMMQSKNMGKEMPKPKSEEPGRG